MATPTPASGTATPMDLDPEQVSLSLKVSLADLSAKAAALFAHKKWEEAAEVYAQAAEMQHEMNGEMSTENAEILFLYGRALFKVGQMKSDVLGNKAPETASKPKPAKKAKTSHGDTENKNGDATAAKVDEAAAEAVKDKKPLFHFEGDENFEGSDEEDSDNDDGGDEEDDEEDDDLGIAFEILDLARVMFEKKLDAVNAETETGKGKEVSEGDSPAARHIKERLADTHSLLAEASLENGRYPNAVIDSRASLKYNKELYPQESEIIAEAHFKLSLALEFASVTRSADDADQDAANPAGVVDQALRDEAAVELEAAIASTKLKLQNKEVELATLHNPEDNDLTREAIADLKDIVADMEQRLVELRKPPIDVAGALAMAGPAASKQAAENATDLSGLVRKKRKAEAPEGEAEPKKAKNEGSGN